MYRRNSCFVRATTLQAAEKLKEVPQGRLKRCLAADLGFQPSLWGDARLHYTPWTDVRDQAQSCLRDFNRVLKIRRVGRFGVYSEFRKGCLGSLLVEFSFSRQTRKRSCNNSFRAYLKVTPQIFTIVAASKSIGP